MRKLKVIMKKHGKTETSFIELDPTKSKIYRGAKNSVLLPEQLTSIIAQIYQPGVSISTQTVED